MLVFYFLLLFEGKEKFMLVNASLEMYSNLALVRADVSRLPFTSGSVDAVHAGAALHCWPTPSNAVSSISSCILLI